MVQQTTCLGANYNKPYAPRLADLYLEYVHNRATGWAEILQSGSGKQRYPLLPRPRDETRFTSSASETWARPSVQGGQDGAAAERSASLAP